MSIENWEILQNLLYLFNNSTMTHISKSCCWIRPSLFLNLYDCLEETRQRGRFAGFSLHVSVNEYIPGSKLCYKNVSQVPPLNFTTTCRTYGRYIIYYNERLHGVTYPSFYEIDNVYTELCEVIVKGNV